ncbi:iron-siderophore ABC transporter substrate-binding protein [Rhodococcus rhodnii]|uniref:Iron ABC transporter periplasmic-binding protein n=2 Tax=Rhodococcus rhodnii TaxID=38312 RepID=R7WPQ7_9NOCA|nr:iron-siderophore ABC transporter substrate-binding protein [Rhodococcus rhodnii]EOM77260.1 iron ABC transporter periplasmic-binding protein [Rhodococcus rhodnii LMG 5362]TXG91496.1 iron-siderophore ABC transporter substrate-binding protein [Rhodococcus rhodnii]
MRNSVIVAAVAAAVMFVGACSSTTDEPEPAAASEQGAFPATVDTKFGDVTIEQAPQRVVALGWGDAETALALGVQPVGASDWLDFGGDGVGPWAEGLYETPPEIIGTLEPSYEQVAALAPDLILDTKSAGEQARHDTLSAIAPTISLPEGADNYKTTPEQQVTMIATVLGVPDEGRALLDDLDARFDAAREAHPEFEGRTITVAALSGGGWGAYTADTERVEFMTRLGFVPNPAIDELPVQKFSAPVSEENLDVLDADFVVVFPIQRTAEDAENTELFRTIPAVADGRYLVFDDPTIAKSYSTNSVLSLRSALDQVVPMVAERI